MWILLKITCSKIQIKVFVKFQLTNRESLQDFSPWNRLEQIVLKKDKIENGKSKDGLRLG